MFKTHFEIYLILLMLFSCTHEHSKSHKKHEIDKEKTTIIDQQDKSEFKSQKALFQKIKRGQIPYIDTTNFDNYTPTYTKDQNILTSIKLQQYHVKPDSVEVKYHIPLSDNYTSLVVSYYIGPNELFTTLINIDRNNKVIDKLDIAYDEIAESFLQKTGTVMKDKIEIRTYIYIDEDYPKPTVEIYKITKEGKFELQ